MEGFAAATARYRLHHRHKFDQTLGQYALHPADRRRHLVISHDPCKVCIKAIALGSCLRPCKGTQTSHLLCILSTRLPSLRSEVVSHRVYTRLLIPSVRGLETQRTLGTAPDGGRRTDRGRVKTLSNGFLSDVTRPCLPETCIFGTSDSNILRSCLGPRGTMPSEKLPKTLSRDAPQLATAPSCRPDLSPSQGAGTQPCLLVPGGPVLSLPPTGSCCRQERLAARHFALLHRLSQPSSSAPSPRPLFQPYTQSQDFRAPRPSHAQPSAATGHQNTLEICMMRKVTRNQSNSPRFL